MTMVVSQHLSGGLEECLGPLEVWLEFPPPLPAMLLPDTFGSGDNGCSIPLKMVNAGVDKLPNKCTRVREKLLKITHLGKN